MTCEEVHEFLLDAAQSPVAAIGEHLRACASCAKELESIQKTMALLDEWHAPEPSPYFDSRLRARLREATVAPRGWLVWLRAPAIAFALAILMVVSVALFRNAPNHDMHKPSATWPNVVQTGTAIGDLQELERDGDMYANFDLLDDLGAEAETANP
jgi:hypothetical protein